MSRYQYTRIARFPAGIEERTLEIFQSPERQPELHCTPVIPRIHTYLLKRCTHCAPFKKVLINTQTPNYFPCIPSNPILFRLPGVLLLICTCATYRMKPRQPPALTSLQSMKGMKSTVRRCFPKHCCSLRCRWCQYLSSEQFQPPAS